MRRTIRRPGRTGTGATSAHAGEEAARPTHPILELQRRVGNQAVGRMLGADRARQQGVAAPAIAGGDAPVPIHPLTDEERAFDLQADRFRDDERLQKAFDDRPPMGQGESGEAVATLQQALIDIGFGMPRSTDATGKPDGIFGQETYRVVRGFQLRQGIVQDGIVGRQTLGELDGIFSGSAPPGSRASGPETPGDPVTVSEIELRPKTFGACGGFLWDVDWNTNGRNGYLVQEITKEYELDECDTVRPDTTFTPLYWEAWRVQEDGGVHGTSGPDDMWRTPSADAADPTVGFPGTNGHWKIQGRVFFVEQLDPAADFKFGKVADAVDLWSTTTQPTNLGEPLLTRSAERTWNCCAAAPSGTPKPTDETH